MSEILLVDDEKNIVSQWRQALRPLGHHVSAFLSAAEALAACDEQQFDLVIVDFLMPEMTGVELINAIRKKIPTIRSILISGKLDKKMDENAVKSVMQDRVDVDVYLKKPVENEDLRSAVTALLSSGEVDWVDWAEKGKAARRTTDRAAKEASADLKKHLKK